MMPGGNPQLGGTRESGWWRQQGGPQRGGWGPSNPSLAARPVQRQPYPWERLGLNKADMAVYLGGWNQPPPTSVMIGPGGYEKMMRDWTMRQKEWNAQNQTPWEMPTPEEAPQYWKTGRYTGPRGDLVEQSRERWNNMDPRIRNMYEQENRIRSGPWMDFLNSPEARARSQVMYPGGNMMTQGPENLYYNRPMQGGK